MDCGARLATIPHDVGAMYRKLLHSPLRKYAAAAMLAGAVATAYAAPNPISGPKGAQEFQTAASNAILIDADSGSVLFEKRADDLIPPASLSKLMTAEVVFNEITQGRRKLTDEFSVSTNAWRRGGAPSHTSSMFLPIHSKAAIDDLLHGVIIQSGNDACITLAEGISGSEGEFAQLMTARARELGLTKSTFGNSTGLPDPRQLMTSRELGKLAQHIIQTYPDFYKYYGEREFTWNKIRQFNRNPLLAMSIGADGLKTGFTKEAGYGLVGSAVQNGLLIVGQRSQDREGAATRPKLLNGASPVQSSLLFDEGRHRGGQDLRRQPALRAVDGDPRHQADAAARRARAHHCPRRLFGPGSRAGAERPEDRQVESLAWRLRRARSSVAGGRGCRDGRAARPGLGCRDGARHRTVPRGHPAAIIQPSRPFLPLAGRTKGSLRS